MADEPPLNIASREDGLPGFSPDFVEAAGEDIIDNIVPTAGYSMIPIVGLGGSAGSIPALCHFFEAMPQNANLVFVVVLHLSAEHESNLADILQRHTSMRVVQAQDGVEVEANTVYVIPPGKHLASTDGHLRLIPLQSERGRRVAVDIFFRTLADTHGAHAAAVVLSGGDGDGSVGIKRIKERGGLTVAQDPGEAEHPGMPKSAIETGMVDWVLTVREMPRRILDYLSREKSLELPPEQPPGKEAATEARNEGESTLREILTYLRTRTGRDFINYKRATILRRISRRIQVNVLHDLPEYLSFLSTHPGELEALQQDLLISVTNFFRDRDCFTAIEQQIPALFRGKGPSDSLRVWCAACATGEEAYSLAMLLFEHAHTLEAPPQIQVFATDLNEEAVQGARDGIYPEAIAADVSEDRLRRFFVKEHRGYRICRELRESVLFAAHDLLKDPPFSRLDLISCRNLLIYLNREAQRRALDIFHFALLSQGRLFLGSSESAEDAGDFFLPIDKKNRIYSPRQVPRSGVPISAAGGTLVRSLLERERSNERPSIPPSPGTEISSVPSFWKPSESGTVKGWGELHLRVFEQAGPASLLVDSQHDVVHLSGKAGNYLHFSSGEMTRNLMLVVHPFLRIELRAALYRATQSRQPAEALDVPFEMDGVPRAVDIHVFPAGEIAHDYHLIVFNPRPASPRASLSSTEADPIVRQLERELEGLKSHLREVVEQHEIGTEEQKASNEELQAMNEELRSATEELETSREELQSINEELTTVNLELKGKVDELGHTNSDLHNLMNATAIAIVFLDRDLLITRYTPTAISLFNLIPTDIGRPLTDLKHRLDYPDLERDARKVLNDLAPIVREVGKMGDGWFLARLLPYRTLDDHIGGVVLTFVDITQRRQAEQASLLQSTLIELSYEPIFIWELEDGIVEWNQGCEQLYGHSKKDAVGQNSDSLLVTEGNTSPEDRRAILREDGHWTGEIKQIAKDGRVLVVESRQQLIEMNGRQLILESNRDITRRTASESALRESEKALSKSDETLRLLLENAREYAIFSTDLDLRITTWNHGAERLVGYRENEILGKPAEIIFTGEDRVGGAPELEKKQALADGRASDERWHQRKDGSRFWSNGFMMAMHDGGKEAIGFVKILRDATDELRAAQSLEESRKDLEAALIETERARAEAVAAGHAKDHFLAVLSHELRTPLTPVLVAARILSRRSDLPVELREQIDMISRNVHMEAELIDGLLDATRIARGKLEISPAPMNLHAAVFHALEVCDAEIKARRQQVEVALHASRHEIMGDASRLQQVFWNLIKNASKFTPDKGRMKIESRLDGDDRIEVAISDSGMGISPEASSRIFNSFEQGDLAVTRQYGGLGLGLAISKAIVEAHQGIITGSSDGIGKGAIFSVILKLQPEGKGAMSAPIPPVSLRVLVVENHPDTLRSLQLYLEQEGHTVSTSRNLGGGIDRLQSGNYDVVISDIGLPDGSGWDLFRDIVPRKIPFGIAMSGFGMNADRTRSLAAGFRHHLLKPFRPEELDLLLAEASAA